MVCQARFEGFSFIPVLRAGAVAYSMARHTCTPTKRCTFTLGSEMHIERQSRGGHTKARIKASSIDMYCVSQSPRNPTHPALLLCVHIYLSFWPARSMLRMPHTSPCIPPLHLESSMISQSAQVQETAAVCHPPFWLAWHLVNAQPLVDSYPFRFSISFLY